MANTDFIDTCIVGAGVIGLAVGRVLARAGMDVLVIERGPRFGEGISSRNSEVIHAGIYYDQGSLKANLCVRGRQLLYDYCRQAGVAHWQTGKFIVATDSSEEAQLENIRLRAAANGVDDLCFVANKQLQAEEPALVATAALLSPSTGIVSSHELMTALLGDMEHHGGTLAVNASVQSVAVTGSGFRVGCEIDGAPYELDCRQLINAAGLGAQALARCIDALDSRHVPPLYLCKGNYFLYRGTSPFNRLIYPVPDPSGAGLGVHATLDIGGQVRFGPDVEYVDDLSYDVSDEQLGKGVQAIQRYFPDLDARRLVPGYAGIRPKLQGPGGPVQDFVIQSEQTHSIHGLVNLFGIESPGLTSSMAIAETVASRLGVPGFHSGN